VTLSAASGETALVRRTAKAALPTRWGEFTCWGFDALPDGPHHLALVHGDLAAAESPLVRVHSECLTGDVFGSARCDCGEQLDEAMRLIVADGAGAVVYLRGHEGRGIGIANKLRAYELQEAGTDTVDANLALGLPVDGRSFAPAAAILRYLEVRRLRLITNNPDKCDTLTDWGIEVSERISIDPVPTRHNLGYLRTKKDRMGHLFELPAMDSVP
jgi:3,4-dihydroxy 2-butanone 4-phosphate synthase/GTP cyclohydrolase II